MAILEQIMPSIVYIYIYSIGSKGGECTLITITRDDVVELERLFLEKLSGKKNPDEVHVDKGGVRTV